ncbi:ATPase [Brevibacillus sp. NRS-1366]|uniref:ATPase n=1 Tax=Brevibacillus sp. NRS-1366 TaxID=3233899 RepID=UPI003D1C75BF
MFKLGQRVVIVADSFEQGLPLGEYGYLIARDRNPDSAFAWVIRIPKIDKQFPVVEEDIDLEERLLEEEAARVSHEALLDYALATRNEALFRQLMGMQDVEETNDEPAKESMEDFIRKVNMKAWI